MYFPQETFVRAVAADVVEYVKDNHGAEIDIVDIQDIVSGHVRYLFDADDAKQAFLESLDVDEDNYDD